MENCQVVQKTSLFRAKWIQLTEATWKDPHGVTRQWEVAERTTRRGDTDAVVIMAFLKKPNEPDQIILVKQFRPPVNAICIENPAGLIDGSESAEIAALRELHEETGYVGTVKFVSPATVNDPGMSNANCKMVFVEIDGTDPRNQNPVAKNDDGEFIEVLMVPVSSLLSNLGEWSAKGWAVAAQLYDFALGLNYSAILSGKAN